jgi:hypothetical protein
MCATYCVYVMLNLNNTCVGVLIMKFLIVQFYPVSCHFVRLVQAWSLCLFLIGGGGDQVSHTSKTMGKILVVVCFLLANSLASEIKKILVVYHLIFI